MKIKNNFLKKTSIYFIGTLSTKMISVLLVPIYAYFVKVNDLSEYDYIVTIASTFSPIVFAAIWESVLKFGMKTGEQKEKLFSTVLAFSFVMILISLGTIPIISLFKGYSSSLIFAILFIIVQGIAMIWQYAARALQENKCYVVASVIGSIVLISIDIIFIIFKKLDFIGLSVSYLISQIIIAVVLEIRIHLLLKFKIRKVSKHELYKILCFSLPLVINNVSLWLYFSGSRIIIKNYIGVKENGLYAFASKFSLLISLISMVISMAVIEEAYSYKSLEEYRMRMSNLISIISKAYFSIIGLAIPNIYILYNIAFKNTEYYQSVDYVFLLLLGALFTALSNNFGSSFQVIDKTKYIFITTILGAITALGVSLVLCNFWGIYGVLIGNIIGPLVMMLIRVVFAKYKTGLNISWRQNVLIFIVSCSVYLILMNVEMIIVQILLLLFSFLFTIYEYRKELQIFSERFLGEKKI